MSDAEGQINGVLSRLIGGSLPMEDCPHPETATEHDERTGRWYDYCTLCGEDVEHDAFDERRLDERLEGFR